jgi:hypothetical protein
LHSPEAPSRENGRLLTRAGRTWGVDNWRRHGRCGWICFCVAGCDTEERSQRNKSEVSGRLHDALHLQYETMMLLDWSLLRGEKFQLLLL